MRIRICAALLALATPVAAQQPPLPTKEATKKEAAKPKPAAKGKRLGRRPARSARCPEMGARSR